MYFHAVKSIDILNPYVMATLHALLVGIDSYPVNGYKLDYSCESMNNFSKFLSTHLNVNAGWKLIPTLLPNQLAIRGNIIKALENLKPLKPGDVFLFYFAGHGSYERRHPRNKLFSEDKIETIITYDSRVNKTVLDIADKELAVLISNIVKKGVHFTAIMDCCNSGDNTKEWETGIGLKITTVPPNVEPREPEKFYGYKNLPIIPNHVQMAACGPDDTASDGLFTKILIETLNNPDSKKSNYEKVMNFVKKTIDEKKIKQAPNLININPDLNKLPFLNNAVWLGPVPKP